MCGIAGMALRDPSADLSAVDRMAVLLRHRGPDHTGFHKEPGLGLASTRLSILDVSHGADMPMWSDDRTLAIVYNGEVYNFRELRAELESRGHVFRTTGDTEVVLEAWREWGRDCFRRLNGMFGLCIFDRARRRLILARDAFGKKNVYVYADSGTFCFASETKAIWDVLPGRLTLDDRAVMEFVATDHVIGTMFRECREIPPGGTLEFDLASFRIDRESRYHSTRDWIDPDAYRAAARMSPAAVQDETERLLRASVQARLVSDAPVGVMCSGGVDSSLITLFAAGHRAGIEAFTVDTPDDALFSERRYAEEVCRKAGTPINVFELDRKAYHKQVVENIYHNDIPPSHLGSSIGVYYVCRMARDRGVKVLLSGEGADETFCGYFGRYRINLIRNHILGRHAIRGMMPKMISGLFPSDSGNIFERNILKSIQPMDLACIASRLVTRHGEFQEFAARFREMGEPQPEIAAMAVADLEMWISSILLRTDRASMQASVEARIPFLDDALTRFALNLPVKHRVSLFADKLVLKRLLSREMGRRFAFRSKVGFGVPFHAWELNLPALFAEGFVIDYFGDGILRMAASQPPLLNKLIILEIWHRLFIQRSSVDAVKGVVHRGPEVGSVRVAGSGEGSMIRSEEDRRALATIAITGEGPSEQGFIRRGDTLHFTATVVSPIIGLIASLVAAKFLLPAELGGIQSVMLLAGYLAYLDLGVTSGLFRNIPLYVGRGESARVQPLVDASWMVTKLVAFVGLGVAAGVMAWSFAVRRDPLMGWASLGLAAYLVAAPFDTFFTILFRGMQQFHLLGRRLHWKNMVQAVTTVFPALWGPGGLIAKNILLPIAGACLLRPGLPFNLGRAGRWADALHLSKVGLPILGVNLLTSFLMVADRSVVAVFLGTEAVGHYALATLILAGLPVLPAALGAILYPRAAHDFGRAGSSRALRKFFWVSFLFNLGVMIPASLLCYWLLGPLTRRFLPEYTSGIPAAELTALGSVFLLYVGQANILVVVRRNFLFGVFLATSIAIVWLVGGWLSRIGWGIEGVAMARLIANAFLCISVVLYAGYCVHKDIRCED